MTTSEERDMENHAESSTSADLERSSTDWYYHGIRLKNYRTPMTQVVLIGLIAFMTVGMSSALNGAGGGGLLNTQQSTNANVAVYSTFAALAFFAGTIYNRVGIRVCLMFGGFGYAFLESAYFATAHIGDRATAFIVVAGCVEGLSAAMLWTAQGAVTMGYPCEDEKGKAFAVFWTIFQMGGVIGSIIPICLNWNSKAGTVSDATVRDPSLTSLRVSQSGNPQPMRIPAELIRAHATVHHLHRHHALRVPAPAAADPLGQSRAQGQHRRGAPQRAHVELGNPRAPQRSRARQVDHHALPLLHRLQLVLHLPEERLQRAFLHAAHPLLQWPLVELRQHGGRLAHGAVAGFPASQIQPDAEGADWVGVFVRGHACDLGGWVGVCEGYGASTESRRYAPYIIIYVFWSLYDGIFQAYAYWLLGSLSNNSARLSHYSGWYKSLQSAGAAVVWRLDGIKISYVSMYLSTWIILLGSIACTTWVAWTKVKEHSEDEGVMIVAERSEEERGDEAVSLAGKSGDVVRVKSGGVAA
ncbi:hypothetical protein BP6252_11493 [Coleophoma cylindrospora]|uniref:Uncharacterized protein n=1 Tax=Coleophoma cylindrospora TaxID=1849047 RepID=A0A3D8QK62_9HELO|nr:hypothetical protein BP6252_11493 [Coleophoma cylindrospora]